MQRIFISYSRIDEAFAKRLATALSDAGADVWIDLEDIPAGANWSSAIQTGLDTADALVLIVSPEAMASENVTDEWQYALDHNRPVIPLRWRPTKMHFQLHRKQYVDFHEQPFDTAFASLIAELQRQRVSLSMPATASSELRAKRKPLLAGRRFAAGAVMIAVLLGFFALSRLPLGSDNALSLDDFISERPPSLIYDETTLPIQLHTAIGGDSNTVCCTSNARFERRYFNDDDRQYWYEITPLNGGATGYQIADFIDPSFANFLRIVPISINPQSTNTQLHAAPNADAASAQLTLTNNDRIKIHGYWLDDTQNEWQYITVITQNADYSGWRLAPADLLVADVLPVYATTRAQADLYGQDPTQRSGNTGPVLRTVASETPMRILRRAAQGEQVWYLVAAYNLTENWQFFWTSAASFNLNGATHTSLQDT